MDNSRNDIDFRALHAAILHSSLDCIITIDQAGKILDFNYAAEQTFGYHAWEVIGRVMSECIIPPSLRKAHTRGMQRHAETGRGYVIGNRIELTAMRKDGSEFPVEVAVTEIKQERRSLFTAYVRDISARKQTEERLLLLQDEQERRVRERTNDLAKANASLRSEISERRQAETKAREAEDRVRELNQVLERRLSRLNGLRKVDLATSGNKDLSITLSLIAKLATSELAVDAASVHMLEGEYLNCVAHCGFLQPSVLHQCKLGDGNAGQAALGTIVRVDSSVPRSKRDKSGRTVYAKRDKVMQSEKFTFYIGVPLYSRGGVKGVLNVYHRGELAADGEWMDFLETLAGQAGIAIENFHLLSDLQNANIELTLAYDTTIEGWSRALDLRDNETEGHSQRVTSMTIRLARHFGMVDEQITHIRRGALLHDIGKMGIPDHILLKPGPLSPDDWEIMRLHPVYAYRLLAPIDFLRPALDIPYCHHEKWDGTGYPRGLHGDQIPLAARLFAVVDVWDALRSDRPYRRAWPDEKVIEHIRSLSGTHFETNVVEAFISLGNEAV
ncbi:MAG: HD domain-containing phosphohydrolase [Capsulimonadaceae bacterium]